MEAEIELHWTHGIVHVELFWFVLMILSVCAEMIWTTMFIVLASVNRHTVDSYTYGLVSLISLMFISVIAKEAKITGIAAILLTAHTLMIVVTAFELRRQFKT
jgi:hypothetical protein